MKYRFAAFSDSGFRIDVILISDSGEKVYIDQAYATNKVTTLYLLLAHIEALDIDNFPEIKQDLLDLPYSKADKIQELNEKNYIRELLSFSNPYTEELKRLTVGYALEINNNRLHPVDRFYDELEGKKVLTELQKCREVINNYWGYEVVPEWLTVEV